MQNLSPKMLEALREAAGKKSGIVSSGLKGRVSHDPSTLRALAKRGLMSHVGSGGPYYATWHQYRITDAGRAFASELRESA